MSSTPTVVRSLHLAKLLEKKSYFLLAPRQTGKSFLIAQTFQDARLYDLLDTSVYLALSQRPQRLAEELTSRDRLVVIDEIQRLPGLLNEVHRLTEQRGVRFLLTGSSARKLRQGGVNLLGGRARTKYLHPLTQRELGARFDLNTFIVRGSLPSIYFSDDPRADLDAYTGSYLQQEIVAEGATRNISAFSRFLKVAAYCNATIVNFTNVASDAQAPRTTVYEYFEILKDTFLLHELPAWRESKQRKPLASSKYYFFASASSPRYRSASTVVARRSTGRRWRPISFMNSEATWTMCLESRCLLESKVWLRSRLYLGRSYCH